MTVAIPTPNTAAALRRDTPLSTAPTTRSRKSREYGRAMHAGPLPSMQLESQFRAWRNPLSRLDQAGYRSRLDGEVDEGESDWLVFLVPTSDPTEEDDDDEEDH